MITLGCIEYYNARFLILYELDERLIDELDERTEPLTSLDELGERSELPQSLPIGDSGVESFVSRSCRSCRSPWSLWQ